MHTYFCTDMFALLLLLHCATRRRLKLKLRLLKLRLRSLSFLGGKWLGEVLGRGVIAKVETATATATATRLQLFLHSVQLFLRVYFCTNISAHLLLHNYACIAAFILLCNTQVS